MSSLRSRPLADLLTFTRASTATYCNADGLLVTAANDVPRIDYDPATRAVRGLLMEEQRTNVLLRSQEFDNASWSKVRATVTADTAKTTAPDGTWTADELLEDTTASDTHYVLQSYTKGSTTESQLYAASVWVKAAGRSQMSFRCQGSSGAANGAYALFDLAAGTAGAVTVSGAWDNGHSRIEAWPNGWYRCTLGFRVNNDAQAQVQVIIFPASSGSVTFTGSGATALYLWGGQLEKGFSSTAYIPTTTLAVVRSGDSLTTSDLEPWINEAEGTLFVEYQRQYTGLAIDSTSRRLATLDDGTGNNRHLIYTSGANRYTLTTDDAVQQAAANLGAVPTGTPTRIAMAWKDDDYASVATGAALLTDASGPVPTGLTTLRIGVIGAQANAHIRKVRFYPRRLSNSELSALVA